MRIIKVLVGLCKGIAQRIKDNKARALIFAGLALVMLRLLRPIKDPIQSVEMSKFL